jgi:hypothetical protein
MVSNGSGALPHRQEQQLLSALTSDAVILKSIAEAGLRRSWWSPEHAWHRLYGRFDPGQAPLVTLVFEAVTPRQEICLIEVFKQPPRERGPGEIALHDHAIGWLRVMRFPCDPALPELSAVIAEAKHPTVVRYRPYNRCTIRFEGERRDQPAKFAKVFSDNRGALIYKENLALWRAADAGDFTFSVVEGVPIRERLFREDGANLAALMGRVVASLPRSSLRPRNTFDAVAQMQRSTRYATELGRRIPGLKKEIDVLIHGLEKTHYNVEHRTFRPIHGAPHMHQWLENGSRLALVDFDRLCMGDPELDVATFMTEMDFENPKRVPVERINYAFLKGYESVFGSLRHTLLQAYRAHKCLAKALKAARRVHPDVVKRVTRHLQRSQTYLANDVE